MKWNILFRLSALFLFLCLGTAMSIWMRAVLGYDVKPYMGLFSVAVIGFLVSAVGVGVSASKI